MEFPENVVLGITLDTNRDRLCQAVSKAPLPSERYDVFKSLNHPRKMVTVEPVMDFDLETMVCWMEHINPCMVWLGYDSSNTDLPEPELAKVKELHWELGRRGFVVMLKTMREASYVARRNRSSQSRTASKAPTLSPSAVTSDWDERAIRAWARTAEPSSRLAMWILAHGLEKTVTELNAAAVLVGFKDAKGAIVGGIKAAATRNSRAYPLEHVRASARRSSR